ncbi:hypothetical protein IFM89_017120 [Coptis chinensis]|uniref:Uncharacterized protein n=1 Tax=Coptis chinensis TaxID=261450 RepID=A0A835HMQ7_9MAGN|nr:hypothetical protein IFM89_017120 [Coptis chinensis]
MEAMFYMCFRRIIALGLQRNILGRRLSPLLEKSKSAAEYVIRVSFGTALIASIVIVYTTIIALLSSSSRRMLGMNSRNLTYKANSKKKLVLWNIEDIMKSHRKENGKNSYWRLKHAMQDSQSELTRLSLGYFMVLQLTKQEERKSSTTFLQEQWTSGADDVKIVDVDPKGGTVEGARDVWCAEDIDLWISTSAVQYTRTPWYEWPDFAKDTIRPRRFWDPYYYKRQQTKSDDNGMNFIESVRDKVHLSVYFQVFSFVFGDGDPNQGIEEERWKLIGEYIASNGGVVSAEELAPYLDVPPKDETMQDDESYILRVLLRFDGQPEVDEEGNILYRFPSLQRTASSQRSRRKEYVGKRWTDFVGGVDKIFKENKWQFSKTKNTEKAMVIGLGRLNLFGVIILGTMLNTAIVPSGFISFVADIFRLLQIYAGSFFTFPLVRWLQKSNAEIEKRNKARQQRAQLLESPDLSLRKKLLSARDMAQKTHWARPNCVQKKIGHRLSIIIRKHLITNSDACDLGPRKMWHNILLNPGLSICRSYSTDANGFKEDSDTGGRWEIIRNLTIVDSNSKTKSSVE